MRHTGGWVKLHRSLIDHPSVEGSGTRLGIFMWLLLSANWKPGRVKFDGKLIDVKPGQVVTSAIEMAERLVIPRRTLERALQWFTECGSIVQQVTSHGRIITLVNWEAYQSYEDEDGQQMANKRPTDDQRSANQRAHSEEEKKLRREEGKKKTVPGGSAEPPPPAPDDHASHLAAAAEFALEAKEAPGATRAPKPGARRGKGVPSDGSLVFLAYAAAYERVYGHQPKRNAKTNAHCAQLVQRLGVEDACCVADFYLTHRGGFYSQKLHMIQYAVGDAEKLLTEFKLGRQMTTTRANQIDKNAANNEALQTYLSVKGPI